MPHSICHPPPSSTLHSCCAPSPLITPACVCVGPWSPDEMDNTVCRLLGNCHDADSRLFCIKCKTNVFIDKKISVELEQRLKMGYGETECLRSWLESILKPMLRSLDFIKEGNDIVRFCFVLFTWTALQIYFSLNFIGVELLYHVVLVSAVEQSESPIHIHTSPLFWVSFPFRSPQSIDQSPLCCIHQVLINYLFYIWQYMHVSSNLPIHPNHLLPLGVCTFVLYLCVYFCFTNKFICVIFLDSTYK